MANCPNCGAKLSCGCQRRTASDGKQGCAQCIPKYEEQLKGNQRAKVQRPPQGGNHYGNRGNLFRG